MDDRQPMKRAPSRIQPADRQQLDDLRCAGLPDSHPTLRLLALIDEQAGRIADLEAERDRLRAALLALIGRSVITQGESKRIAAAVYVDETDDWAETIDDPRCRAPKATEAERDQIRVERASRAIAAEIDRNLIEKMLAEKMRREKEREDG